jgi:hypothetical protein
VWNDTISCLVKHFLPKGMLLTDWLIRSEAELRCRAEQLPQ